VQRRFTYHRNFWGSFRRCSTIKEKNSKLCTRLASRTTNNSIEIVYTSDINLWYTFDKSTVKIDRWILFPYAHVTACDFLGFIESFWNSTRISATHDWWGKPLHVGGGHSRPAGPRWLTRKIFFWPISRTEFDKRWNWFGKNKGTFHYAKDSRISVGI